MSTTEQEAFWAGGPGDEYTSQNSDNGIGSQIHFFSDILRQASGISSAFEVGANAGLNLDALRLLSPRIDLFGCDINKRAVEISKSKGHDVDHCSIFDLQLDRQFDLVFTRGVLVHINPDRLNDAYDRMGRLSRKYLLIDEYFSPVPVPIKNYKGRDDVLFKRDFGRELLNRLRLELVAYGFNSKIDPSFPGYDTNWYLFRKR